MTDYQILHNMHHSRLLQEGCRVLRIDPDNSLAKTWLWTGIEANTSRTTAGKAALLQLLFAQVMNLCLARVFRGSIPNLSAATYTRRSLYAIDGLGILGVPSPSVDADLISRFMVCPSC